jgi:hypothetical protein
MGTCLSSSSILHEDEFKRYIISFTQFLSQIVIRNINNDTFIMLDNENHNGFSHLLNLRFQIQSIIVTRPELFQDYLMNLREVLELINTYITQKEGIRVRDNYAENNRIYPRDEYLHSLINSSRYFCYLLSKTSLIDSQDMFQQRIIVYERELLIQMRREYLTVQYDESNADAVQNSYPITDGELSLTSVIVTKEDSVLSLANTLFPAKAFVSSCSIGVPC